MSLWAHEITKDFSLPFIGCSERLHSLPLSLALSPSSLTGFAFDMTAGLWGDRVCRMGEGLPLLPDSSPRPPSKADIETGDDGAAWLAEESRREKREEVSAPAWSNDSRRCEAEAKVVLLAAAEGAEAGAFLATASVLCTIAGAFAGTMGFSLPCHSANGPSTTLARGSAWVVILPDGLARRRYLITTVRLRHFSEQAQDEIM